MFTRGFDKTAKKPRQIRDDSDFPKKRPDPNARPARLYPAVPENFDGWPDKTAQPVNFTGIKIPEPSSLAKPPAFPKIPRVAPPKQPSATAQPVGLKLAAPSSTFAKPPQMGLPKAWPIGRAMTPRPRNTIYTPPASLKDEFGKVKDLPSNVPAPTKVAAAKTPFGKLKVQPLQGTVRKKMIGPQLQTEPLGATMPNQGTGGGITGGYGSN